MNSEIRKDYIQEKYVIIAPRRGKRPHDLPVASLANRPPVSECAFCPARSNKLAAKLTVGGKSQTAPLHLTVDPRNKGEKAALQKQFTLAMQVNDRISQLHQAVNEIRDLRSQIENLHKRFGDDQRLKPALAVADDLDHKMSEVEQKLIQVNMKGSEANLAFPNMLNERFDTFSHLIESGDKEPTKPQLEVFEMLNNQLDDQLKKWAQVKQENVAKVTELIKQANLPALIITEKK